MEKSKMGIELLEGANPNHAEDFGVRFNRVNGSHYISKWKVGRKFEIVEVMRVQRGEDVWNIYSGGNLEMERVGRFETLNWLFNAMGV